MSNTTTFKALLVEEHSDNTFSKKVVEREVSQLPENN
jgi:acrylyl-CoA reductase (NADPH)